MRETGPPPHHHKKTPNFSTGTADFSTRAGHTKSSTQGAAQPQWLRLEWSPFPRTKVLGDFGGRRGRPGVATEAFFAELFRAYVMNIYYYIGLGVGFLLFHPRIELRAASGSPS